MDLSYPHCGHKCISTWDVADTHAIYIYADNGSDLVFVKIMLQGFKLDVSVLLIKFGPTYFVVSVSTMENPNC